MSSDTYPEHSSSGLSSYAGGNDARADVCTCVDTVRTSGYSTFSEAVETGSISLDIEDLCWDDAPATDIIRYSNHKYYE